MKRRDELPPKKLYQLPEDIKDQLRISLRDAIFTLNLHLSSLECGAMAVEDCFIADSHPDIMKIHVLSSARFEFLPKEDQEPLHKQIPLEVICNVKLSYSDKMTLGMVIPSPNRRDPVPENPPNHAVIDQYGVRDKTSRLDNIPKPSDN